MAARAWIRLGAVWVNMNSRAFDISQQCFSLLAVPQGKYRLLSRGLIPQHQYQCNIPAAEIQLQFSTLECNLV